MNRTFLSGNKWFSAALLGGIALLYYASYFDAGFNFADEGNYAQFAFELSRGTRLADLPVSYGFLWFKIGEGLFRAFGPNLMLARLLFFGCAWITALLVYWALWMLTRRPYFAAALAAIPALAPAFLPTAFYGFCVVINTVPQLRLAQRSADAGRRDAAFAGAGLGLAFQIRPDFGYIFAVSLAVLLFLAAVHTPKDRLAYTRRGTVLVAAAAGGFLLAHLPSLAFALNSDYLGALVGQYLSYPVMLADYGLDGLRVLFGGGAAGATEPALLQRPRLIGAQDASELRLALLVYLPPVVIGGFALWTLAKHKARNLSEVSQMLVVLVAGAAALPHYFLYRPDISHIANFMPGFTVLAGVFFWQVLSRERHSAWLAFPIIISAVFGLYLFTALTTEGSGSIAGSLDRTERFQAANGVEVRLNPGEKAVLEDIKAVIEAHSRPGDAIVCVPYCPGIAFMTDRRLLFREQYVDDTLPARDPSWLERAIALTRERRPPVVIVMDWAINGSDNSRFSRWASPYMQALESLAREKLERPGFSIYLL